MPINLGSADRLIRILLGTALVMLALLLDWNLTAIIASVAIGSILVLTALFRFCPLYRLFGMRTCKP